MKRILAFIGFALFVTAPAFCSGLFEGIAGGAGTGALIGSLIAPGIGTAIGAILGGFGGTVAGAITESNTEAATATNLDTAIATAQTDIKSLESQNNAISEALAGWEGQYQNNYNKSLESGEKQLSSLMESWGYTNAALGSQERGGITAGLLSQKQKDKVVAFAGEDLTLNSTDVKSAIDSAYDTTDEASRLSQISAIENSSNKNFGTYEIDLIDTLKSYRQSVQSQQEQIDINKEAIENKKLAIENYKKQKSDLWLY